MVLDPQSAEEAARTYIGTTKPLTRLGWGIGGFVYLSPDLRSAVKVHRRNDGYLRELKAYQILAEAKIIRLHGLTIPKLRGFRDDLNVIQMDCVSPPFLLDFAGVLFSPPDFSSDVLDDWHAKLREAYGPNVSIAYDVYHSLAEIGIYYMDFRPSNMRLDGLPGLLPLDPSEDEDEV